MLGGVCVNTGTIPSKTLREAVVYRTGMNHRELYGSSYRVKDRITTEDLQVRTTHVIEKEVDVLRAQATAMFNLPPSFLVATIVCAIWLVVWLTDRQVRSSAPATAR